MEEDPKNMLTLAGWWRVQNGEVPTGIVTNGNFVVSEPKNFTSFFGRRHSFLGAKRLSACFLCGCW